MNSKNYITNKNVRRKVFTRYILTQAVSVLLLTVFMTGCNEKSPDSTLDLSTSVVIQGFSLKANSKIAPNLDSVFFSIDLDHRCIYNADSLPKGSDVSKLVTVISYPESLSAVTITMSGGQVRSGEVNYMKHPNDSIDYTGKVTLSVTAQDGFTVTNYDIKVNVHKEDPDTLMWDELGVSELPSRLPNPIIQKTVKFDNKAYCFIEESDGSMTLSTCSFPDTEAWDKQILNLPFQPDLATAVSSTNSLYMLDAQGYLYVSNDGYEWNSTGKIWNTIIGSYGNDIIGLKSESADMLFAQYPEGGCDNMPVPTDFPIFGASNAAVVESDWSNQPVIIITGGTQSNGTVSNATWGYDGENWVSISEVPHPALTGAVITQYSAYRYRKTSSALPTEFTAWLLFGGEKEDGTLNSDIYMTLDGGIHWQRCSMLMQLPDYIEPRMQADVITLPRKMSANLNEAWIPTVSYALPSAMTRANYEIDGSIITWECPYLFMFGGYGTSGTLYNSIWKGVLNRLSFTPLF